MLLVTSVADVPDFVAFYRAVHGREPFPWQRRLAADVERDGWPAEIGVPTGLGKTSCIDVAVWSLARQAHRHPAERGAPTRIWYVVNRRLLVDAAYAHGCRLASLLAAPRSPAAGGRRREAETAVEAVGVALASITGGAGAQPLHVSRLRGGAELGVRPSDPSQPSLIFATVPMFASRLMFRGFGTSTSMGPVDAALAGTDSVVLLDESHLARALLNLIEPLAKCDVGDPAVVLPLPRSRPTLVSLTATGDDGLAFALDADDHAHPVVRRRLGAPKPTTLVAATRKTLVAAMVDRLTDILRARPGCTAVVFVNSPRVAREVFGRLTTGGRRGSASIEADFELLTGRIRDREGDAVRERLLDPVIGAPAGRSRQARERHLVVVATQTLEVGADLDFDVLVTEACGVRALVQRLGRLNRLGEADHAEGSIVFAADAEDFGIYEQEPRDVWSRLSEAAVDGCVDLNPGAASDLVGRPADQPGRVGEVLPAHLWEWAKTTTPPEGEAPPELFFSGFDDEGIRVSVLWRVELPEDGLKVVPSVTAAEAVDVPIWEAREALAALGEGTVNRLRPDRVTIERDVAVERIRPGDQVLVAAGCGGYDQHGWAPASSQTVVDPSLLRPPGIPLVARCLEALVAEGDDLDAALGLAHTLAPPPEPDEEIDRTALAGALRDRLIAAGPHPAWRPDEWETLAAGLRAEVDHPIGGMARLVVRAPLSPHHAPDLRSDAFDELSFTATSAALSDHLGTVGELAGRIGGSIGLAPLLVEALVAAGRFHDLGKHDMRFQRWLDPKVDASRPLAKSSRPWHHWQRDRRAAGWPQGGRHEELSRRVIAEWLVSREVPWDRELVLHLVVSHHGYGRPLVPAVRDDAAARVFADVDGETVVTSGDLAEIDWSQPARFRRCCECYGYWGLALLEAVLRQADHQASSVVVA